MARTVNSQQMYEYIVHCLKTTYKYFALPLNKPAAGHKSQAQRGPMKEENPEALNEDIVSDFSQLSIQSQHANQPKAVENGPEDSDCIIEEEEEVEEYSESDEERENEKVDLGKSSLSEDEEEEDVDIDMDMHRHHLDSLTTEDEEIFLVDEISGEELLSDEEGPDLDTPGSMDEEEEEEEVELVPVSLSPSPSEDTVKDESPENNQKQRKLSYEFTRQAFTRGKVSIASCLFSQFICLQEPRLKAKFLILMC